MSRGVAVSPETSIGLAVVTGSARGIGAAIATAWVAAGGHVIVSDIEDDRGSALAEELGKCAEYVHADATSEVDIAGLLDHATAMYGPPAAVFVNAGAPGVTGPIQTTTLEAWHRTVDLLQTSVFVAAKHAVRVMRPAGAGAIVCTASVASLRGGLGPHVYTASKHAVKGLIESIAVEVAPYGLRINGVAPGGVVSSLTAALLAQDRDDLEHARHVLAAESSSGVPTTPEDVAAAALFLAGRGARRVNGVLLAIDGGDALLGRLARGYYQEDVQG